MAVQIGWAGRGFAPLHSEHIVQLYRAETELADNIRAYALEAFRYQHAVLFLATRAHCQRFREELAAAGVDVRKATRSGQLVFMEAEELLPRFMRQGEVDDDAFRTIVEQLLEQCRRHGRFQHVQVFGELVDVLWQQGHADAVLRVERLWNELRSTTPAFTLYCGYHVDATPAEVLVGGLRGPLLTHSHLIDAADAPRTIEAPRGVLVQLADLTRQDAEHIQGALERFPRKAPAAPSPRVR